MTLKALIKLSRDEKWVLTKCKVEGREEFYSLDFYAGGLTGWCICVGEINKKHSAEYPAGFLLDAMLMSSMMDRKYFEKKLRHGT